MAAFFREYRDTLLAFTGIIIALLSCGLPGRKAGANKA